MKRIFSVFVVMMAFSLLPAGCVVGVRDRQPAPTYGPGRADSGPPPWAPAHGYRAKHRYRYYPDPRVYFDTGRSLYFYYDGRSWQASVSLPSGIRISAGDYVTLDMDTDRPFQYHSDVEKRYPPGQLKKKKKRKGKKWR